MASFFDAPPAAPPPAAEPLPAITPEVPQTPPETVQLSTTTNNNSPYSLQAAITISENSSEVFSVKFSNDGKFLAACCGDGAVRVFNCSTGRLSYNLQIGSSLALPSTCVKFRPDVDSVKTKNVLICADAVGSVDHWHMTSGKRLHTMTETTPRTGDKNQVFALDYRPDATQFVTAGKDTIVRLYDESTKQLVQSMERGMGFGPNSSAGHSNRIFSCKYHPGDPNIIVSGGWDNTVQIWDARTGFSQRSIYGPHLCGDSLDLQGDVLVTGSWRSDDPLETWDFGTGKKIASVDWFKSEMSGQSCMLYAAQFSKDNYTNGYADKPKFIAAGGSGANEARVFDCANNNSCIGSITGLSRGVFTVDWSQQETKFAVAGGDASIRIINVVKN